MLLNQQTKVLLALRFYARFYASGNFLQVIGDTLFYGQFFCRAGKPFENKSFAQFFDVK